MLRALILRLSLCVALLGGCAKHSSASHDLPELRPPAAADIHVGPGDIISLKVWRQQELEGQIVIAPDGTIALPLAGRIQVEGMSWSELVAAIDQSLSQYLVDPSISVDLVELNSQKVIVLGEVQNPAVLQAVNNLTILEALARTGGINADARTDNVMLVRGGAEEPQLYLVDVRGIYERGDFSQLVTLQGGDIVVVPSKTIVNVERFFRRMQAVLAPFLAGSAIYRNAVSGGAQGTSFLLSE